MHSSESLKQDLRNAGFSGNETVMVHSSMKKIGEVNGGADTVLDVLCDFFQDGIVALPSFTYSAVNLGNSFIYYERTTPSCVGILPERFRFRPGGCRSLHPNHAVAAFGKYAEDFVKGHETCISAFGADGPFGRLYRNDGKVLLLGVTLTRASIMHAFIEWSNIAIMCKEPLFFKSVDKNGREYNVKLYYHLGGQWDNFDRILDVLLADGAVRKIKFGDADSLLMDCRRAGDIVMKTVQENPKFFYNPDFPESMQYPGISISDAK